MNERRMLERVVIDPDVIMSGNLSRLLDGHAGRLVDRFVVATETQARSSDGTLGGQNGDEVV